jgi:hypothetical protein
VITDSAGTTRRSPCESAREAEASETTQDGSDSGAATTSRNAAYHCPHGRRTAGGDRSLSALSFAAPRPNLAFHWILLVPDLHAFEL